MRRSRRRRYDNDHGVLCYSFGWLYEIRLQSESVRVKNDLVSHHFENLLTIIKSLQVIINNEKKGEKEQK